MFQRSKIHIWKCIRFQNGLEVNKTFEIVLISFALLSKVIETCSNSVFRRNGITVWRNQMGFRDRATSIVVRSASAYRHGVEPRAPQQRDAKTRDWSQWHVIVGWCRQTYFETNNWISILLTQARGYILISSIVIQLFFTFLYIKINRNYCKPK